MNLSNPIRSVIPSVTGDVLGVLGRTGRPLSGRGVADLLGRPGGTSAVACVLRNLTIEGLVIAEAHPPAILYRLNREHLAAEAVIELATMRERLYDLMREQVATFSPASKGAWVFGSFARGAGTSSSDIDVLVVRPAALEMDDPSWRNQLRAFSHRITMATGNDCRVIEFSPAEFAHLFSSRERLAIDLKRDAVGLTRHRLPFLPPS